MKLLASSVDWRSLELSSVPSLADHDIGYIISKVIPIIFVVAGLIMLFYLIYSGFQYMFSQGEPKALQQAKTGITYAIIGFLVIFVAYWVVRILGIVLDINQLRQIF